MSDHDSYSDSDFRLVTGEILRAGQDRVKESAGKRRSDRHLNGMLKVAPCLGRTILRNHCDSWATAPPSSSTKPRLLLIGRCVAGTAKYFSLGVHAFGESLKKAYVSLVRER